MSNDTLSIELHNDRWALWCLSLFFVGDTRGGLAVLSSLQEFRAPERAASLRGRSRITYRGDLAMNHDRAHDSIRNGRSYLPLSAMQKLHTKEVIS